MSPSILKLGWPEFCRHSNSDGMTQDEGKTGCDGWDPNDVSLGWPWTTDKDATQNFVYGEGTTFESYWLTNLQGGPIDYACNPIRNECDAPVFTTPPGIDTLGGSG